MLQVNDYGDAAEADRVFDMLMEVQYHRAVASSRLTPSAVRNWTFNLRKSKARPVGRAFDFDTRLNLDSHFVPKDQR